MAVSLNWESLSWGWGDRVAPPGKGTCRLWAGCLSSSASCLMSFQTWTRCMWPLVSNLIRMLLTLGGAGSSTTLGDAHCPWAPLLSRLLFPTKPFLTKSSTFKPCLPRGFTGLMG